MKVIPLKVFLSYWIRKIDRRGKYLSLIMFFLYFFYFLFYESQYLSTEIIWWMVLAFLLNFLGFLSVVIFEMRKIHQTIYLLENEGDFDFNLINVKEGLLGENSHSQKKVRDKIRENSFLFSSSKITFYLMLTMIFLVIVFPERHLKMKNAIFQTFDLVPPPEFDIEYTQIIKEGEHPQVKNLSKHPLWVRWHGNVSGNWKNLVPDEVHSNLELDRVKTLEVSLRYEKKTYYQKFSITTILKPKIGRIEITTISPFKAKKTYRGQTEIKAYSNSQIIFKIFPVENRAFTKATLFSSAKSLTTKHCMEGESLQLNLIYHGGSQTYDLVFSRSEENISATPITLKIDEISNTPPIIKVQSPLGNVKLNKPVVFEVSYLAKDDTSLKKIVLNLTKNGEKISREIVTFSNAKTFYQGKVVLNLKEFNFLPDDIIFYYFQVWDFYGLTSSNQTLSITYQSIYDTMQDINQNQAKVGTEVTKGLESVQEIKREIEKMEITAEKGDVNKKMLKSFSKKVENVKQTVNNKTKKIKDNIDEIKQKELNLAPSMIKKLQEIEKNLKSLDEEFLAKLGKSAREIANKANLSKKEILDFFKGIKTDELEKKLDEVLGTTRQMKKIQQYFELERLANQIFEYHQDLVNQAKLSESVKEYNEKKTEVEKLLKEFDLAWSENFHFTGDSNKNEEIKSITHQVNLSNLQKDFKNFKASSSLDKKLDYFSTAFENIRKNSIMLSRKFQSLDLDAINEEIDKQILGLSFQSRWLKNLTTGKLMDLKLTKETLLKKKISLFVSEMESILKVARRYLSDLLIGYIPDIIPFFTYYDEILIAKKKLKKQMDPASSRITIKREYLVSELKKQRLSYLQLVHHLIQLKNSLSQNQQKQMNQDQLNRVEKRQRRLNSRTQSMLGTGKKLNSFQKEYLKQIAKEQALIRKMLEELTKQEHKKQSAQTGKNLSGKAKQMDNLVKEMRELEENLRNYKEKNASKIVKRQKKIEENFLIFDKGLRDKSIEKEKGNRSREIDDNFKIATPSSLLYKKNLKKLETDILTKKYPPEYKERILNYFNKLKLSLNKP